MPSLRYVNKEKWDTILKAQYEKGAYNKYPTEPIVVFMAQNYFKIQNRCEVRVLELGCGSGCNLVFLDKERFKAYGIDHSPWAIKISQTLLADNNCSAELTIQCATSLSFADNYFDVCLESNCIHCNTTEDIDLIFKEIHRVLKPGGRFYGILVSDRSADFSRGKKIDTQTFDFSSSQYSGGMYNEFPAVHFFNKKELEKYSDLFSSHQFKFMIETIENRSCSENAFAQWWIQLQK